MKIVCLPQGIVDSKHPRQGILDIASAGFESIVLDMILLCLPWEMENLGKRRARTAEAKQMAHIAEYPEELSDSMNPILEPCRKDKLSFPIAIAPYLNWDTKRADLHDLVKQLTQESIRICAQVGCRHLIVRSLFAGMEKGGLWEKNRAYYRELAEIARQYQVQILLTNQCRNVNGHLMRGICSDGVQAAEWVDALNGMVGEERFGFCMDVGVCNLCGQNMYDFIL